MHSVCLLNSPDYLMLNALESVSPDLRLAGKGPRCLQFANSNSPNPFACPCYWFYAIHETRTFYRDLLRFGTGSALGTDSSLLFLGVRLSL